MVLISFFFSFFISFPLSSLFLSLVPGISVSLLLIGSILCSLSLAAVGRTYSGELKDQHQRHCLNLKRTVKINVNEIHFMVCTCFHNEWLLPV